MNIENFINDENHMCNLSERMFDEIFDSNAIYELPDNNFTKKIVYWLSQYLMGNVVDPIKDINQLDKFERFYVYETWFSLIKETETLKTLSKTIIQHYL
ncbi:hypothetical protein K0M23_004427 [Salmonella enterica]|nr:hypothetical protein [Salmonella enterica]EBX5865117.1 hypothetical protein [Salmonella enterica subsp. enterica serovar Kingston]EAA8067183.1 hypothetical protein [Salmonella enterica]EAZ9280806.1 hypothetical protein [Salmonella enterica]EGG4170970.1 hypothetical protein [Salmonella enterica]